MLVFLGRVLLYVAFVYPADGDIGDIVHRMLAVRTDPTLMQFSGFFLQNTRKYTSNLDVENPFRKRLITALSLDQTKSTLWAESPFSAE